MHVELKACPRKKSFHRRVTVTAVDAVVADVMFMTELDRLLAFDPLTRVPDERLAQRQPTAGQQQ